jgi:hypothetical protein
MVLQAAPACPLLGMASAFVYYYLINTNSIEAVCFSVRQQFTLYGCIDISVLLSPLNQFGIYPLSDFIAPDVENSAIAHHTMVPGEIESLLKPLFMQICVSN